MILKGIRIVNSDDQSQPIAKKTLEWTFACDFNFMLRPEFKEDREIIYFIQSYCE